MQCYQLCADPQNDPQDPDDTSFVGGVPRIPSRLAIPQCGLCGAEETFFFQLAFPADHEWGELSVAVFHCTSCPTKDSTIPPMVKPPLKGAPLPAAFLVDYQINFHFPVFLTTTGRIRTSYRERIRFKRWTLVQTADSASIISKVGGEPVWLLEDESPGLYADRSPMVFLFQLEEGLVFETIAGAPPQASPYTWPGERPNPFYRFCNGNEVYAFGTQDRTNPLVYVLTQRD
jgi:hypothetical protein